jgi:hypothetical protein
VDKAGLSLNLVNVDNKILITSTNITFRWVDIIMPKIGINNVACCWYKYNNVAYPEKRWLVWLSPLLLVLLVAVTKVPGEVLE